MLSAAEVTAMFRNDVPDFIVGTMLCTVGLGVAVFSPRFARRNLIAAGLFACLYGLRMLLQNQTTAYLLGGPPLLRYATATLEYLTPIPASIIMIHYLGNRWRLLNRFTVFVLVAVAVLAIPYEWITRQPHAANQLVNVAIVAMLAVFILNYVSQPRLVRNVASLGGLVFALFVMNEHFRLVPQAPFRLTSEPIGFLFFVGTILYDLLRQSENAQLRMARMETELATARRIQESILPTKVPSMPAIDVASAYIPASTVAGDYFDFIDAGDGCFGAVIADVSGHGVGAALVASMFKVAIAMESPRVREPARLLRQLNEFFCGKLGRQFITAVVAFIDTRSGDVSVASAGHPPPLVRRSDGTVDEVPVSGFVLGRMRNVSYDAAAFALAPGDALVLYTDGIPEARQREEPFGEERLKRAISAAPPGAQGIANTITNQLKAWTTDDDITLVVIGRRRLNTSS